MVSKELVIRKKKNYQQLTFIGLREEGFFVVGFEDVGLTVGGNFNWQISLILRKQQVPLTVFEQ